MRDGVQECTVRGCDGMTSVQSRPLRRTRGRLCRVAARLTGALRSAAQLGVGVVLGDPSMRVGIEREGAACSSAEGARSGSARADAPAIEGGLLRPERMDQRLVGGKALGWIIGEERGEEVKADVEVAAGRNGGAGLVPGEEVGGVGREFAELTRFRQLSIRRPGGLCAWIQ